MQLARNDERRDLERCPLCHAPRGDEALVACASCGTVAHAGCVRDLGAERCPTLGCTVPVPVARKKAARWRVVAAMLVGGVALLAVREWRAHVVFARLRERFEWHADSPATVILTQEPARLRALAVEARTVPRGVTIDRESLEKMARLLEDLADAIDAATKHPARGGPSDP